MVEVGQDSQRAKDWKKVIEQELRTGNVDGVDFRHFFDGFTAATDAPSCVSPSSETFQAEIDPDVWSTPCLGLL